MEIPFKSDTFAYPVKRQLHYIVTINQKHEISNLTYILFYSRGFNLKNNSIGYKLNIFTVSHVFGNMAITDLSYPVRKFYLSESLHRPKIQFIFNINSMKTICPNSEYIQLP